VLWRSRSLERWRLTRSVTGRYAVNQRLRLIDFLLAHYGNAGRAELVDYFGIGPAVATRDFAAYNLMLPGNMALNQATKRWVRCESFRRLLDGGFGGVCDDALVSQPQPMQAGTSDAA
jgi:hypothetical protein